MELREMEQVVLNFINAANAYDTAAVTKLFTPDAVINDSSVGESFEGISGVADYFKTYFIGYKTNTRLISTAYIEPDRINARVDFTGNFGQETGQLEFRINSSGMITYVNAWLE